MNKKRLWQTILNEIELTISKAHFVTWFHNTRIDSLAKNKVIIIVPNGFSKEWLENKFNDKLLEYFEKHYKKINKIDYKIIPPNRLQSEQGHKPHSESLRQKQDEERKKNEPSSIFNTNTNSINPKYRFDNLVEGPHNELAKAACEAVAKDPGRKYNPLFIYGGVGLGKTHLIQAVGNFLRISDPDFKIRYVTSEKFTNDFVYAIREKQIDEFKNLYRFVDVLLIDDIQFIGGKEGTQEQFFHTFNNLYQENKQIILCSDRPPKSIPALEERLCSRFEGGMIVDVTKPDVETREAILLEKAKSLNTLIPNDVLNYIAANVSNNVRELEGYLNRLIAACELRKEPINLENAKKTLGKDFSQINRQLTDPKHIIKSVADFYKIETKKILGKGRKSDIIKPRQISAYLLRKKLKLSFPIIGKELGDRDHTTAMHAHKKAKELIKKDPITKQEVEKIIENYLSG